MAQFMFSVPTRVEFGAGKAGSVGSEAAALFPGKTARMMIVTDTGVKAAGLLGGMLTCLEQAGVEYFIFDQVEPNPRDTTVQQAADLFRQREAGGIIAVGGGSVMDLAKAAAVVAAFGGRIADYDGVGRVPGAIPPLIAIPTTAGTGSEVTFWAIITHTSNHVKMGVGDLKIAPRVALADPLLTLTLPHDLTLGTGLDALTHAVESFTCTVASPPTDSLALQAIRLISASLPPALENGGDVRAREGMMMGSLLAGIAFGNADCGAVHGLSETIGALFDAPHGMVNGILLPYVMAFNLPACPQKFAEIAAAMQADPSPEAAVKKVWEMNLSHRVPPLSAFGVRQNEVEEIAERALLHPCTLSNPRPPTAADFAGILSQALQGATPLA